MVKREDLSDDTRLTKQEARHVRWILYRDNLRSDMREARRAALQIWVPIAVGILTLLSYFRSTVVELIRWAFR